MAAFFIAQFVLPRVSYEAALFASREGFHQRAFERRFKLRKLCLKVRSNDGGKKQSHRPIR